MAPSTTLSSSTLTAGSGASTLADATAAGRAAATEAVKALAGARAELVVVYASVAHDLPALLAAVRSVTGDAPLAGATSAGMFVGGQLIAEGPGVTVLALAGGPYRFGVASSRGMGEDPRRVGAELTRAARAAAAGPDLPHAALVLLTDGLGGDQQAVLAGVHSVAGAAVPVVGGAAADDQRMVATSVFCGDEVLSDAAVGVWVASPRPLRVVSAHGWTPVSAPEVVTRAEGPLIHEIGGRSAAEVWSEHADTSTARRRADGQLWQPAYALGVIQPDGSHLVRGVFATAPGSGALGSFTPLPEYSAVQVVTADVPAVMAVVDDVVERALPHGDERVLLAFDCVARKGILGEHVDAEVAALQRAAGDAVAVGFFTYGEFARTRGVGGVHNATLTALGL